MPDRAFWLSSLSVQQKLLGLLADGQLHSGNALAKALGVSRAAVWKQVAQLEKLGLQVHGQAGKGYRLERSLELLDSQRILEALPAEIRTRLGVLELLWETDSTSDYLIRSGRCEPNLSDVCVAEYQSGGRGRRGRQWFAPIGQGLCLSVAWNFPSAPPNLSCLGLAVGVAVLRAVRSCGNRG